MNDASGEGGFQRIGGLDSERQQSVEFQRVPVHMMLERRAIEKFHGDESLAILLADVVNGADIGVVQRGGGLSFTLKAS
jgi:hypothetical protein